FFLCCLFLLFFLSSFPTRRSSDLFIAVALTFLGGIVVGILNKNKMNHYFVQALTICITIVTTLFAITAIGGLFFILFPEMNLLVLYLFALIALILPGLFLKI